MNVTIILLTKNVNYPNKKVNVIIENCRTHANLGIIIVVTPIGRPALDIDCKILDFLEE